MSFIAMEVDASIGFIEFEEEEFEEEEEVIYFF